MSAQLDLFTPQPDPEPKIDRGWRTTIHMIQWIRLDPTSYRYGHDFGDWYNGIVRENLDRVGGLMGVW
ncbi:MAG: hypothetical protein KAX46_06865 [Chromatiaceae bacterium]|nr:hypothetical protein [Chromatiaceae bacterium]